MNKVARGKRGIAQEQRAVFIHNAFAHLRADKRDAKLVHECAKHTAGQLAVRSGGDDQDRMTWLVESIRSPQSIDFSSATGRRTVLAGISGFVGIFGGDVFGQFDMNGPRFFFLSQAKRFTNA